MDYSFEHEAYLKGYTAVCGIDEAGRGPLAGPVYAAAVWLPEGLVIDGLNDSKKLSEKKREALFDVIKENAVAYGIGFADEKEIDEINILQATYLAMRRAYDNMQKACDYVLIDGNRMPPMPVPGETIVKGDAKSPSIAAASILAKVSRDRVMLEYAKQYPGYHFEKHKGYGTKVHV
ncbi:ribonuclease HII, partial [Hominenteromicrobium sp.]